MNFNIIEGDYTDFDSIHDDFVEDYILNTDLTIEEIRRKYNLSNKKFWNFTRIVKKEFNVTRRPTGNYGKYYYQVDECRWAIKKKIAGKIRYIGCVPSECIAMFIVELCKKVEWDVDVCKDICRNWESYV